MKLTVKKIRYIINNKKKGESSELIRKDMKISKRRVEQIWKFYSETGKEPIIGKNMGRPVKTLDPKEEEIISIAFDRYRFGARMLEKYWMMLQEKFWLVEKYWIIRPMRELIMDHGSEFGAHRIDEKGEWDGEFKQHILKYGIKPILAGVKHPQTNGKLEKFFDSYQRFRNFFPTFDDFIDWYNNRPHGSLNFDELETPEQAFWRKLPMEVFFGIGNRLFGL